ncbi:GAF domain-containing protein [Paenibacillus tarimensis]|uniref:GAF domain-containing protein n=1 Tax=Paenibacillus tarimensis TaxID=416012 RepID=UPI001F40F4D6|nr:GAF domain-containing protein [Paenibacillus tarimensis]MCF2945010.1 GAF domain-containing protein [Paenibacillus tarimensis]
MESVKADILKEIERLRQETGSDFAGLGWIDSSVRRMAWRFALGSVSTRTLNMTQRINAGLSGAAIRSGRPALMSPNAFDAAGQREAEPVMLAESLQAAAVLPLCAAGDIRGVLLLGRRSGSFYTREELDQAFAQVEKLAGRMLQLQAMQLGIS